MLEADAIKLVVVADTTLIDNAAEVDVAKVESPI
jgi:hypothetical protein